MGARIRVQVHCCFTSTETIRSVRDGEPRTATSTFTQLLNSDASETTKRAIKELANQSANQPANQSKNISNPPSPLPLFSPTDSTHKQTSKQCQFTCQFIFTDLCLRRDTAGAEIIEPSSVVKWSLFSSYFRSFGVGVNRPFPVFC